MPPRAASTAGVRIAGVTTLGGVVAVSGHVSQPKFDGGAARQATSGRELRPRCGPSSSPSGGTPDTGGYRRYAWTRTDHDLREWFAGECAARGLDARRGPRRQPVGLVG